MSRVGVWILGAALGSFAAGMVVGWMVPQAMAAGSEPSADADYVREMVARYELRPEQVRSLRIVLQGWRDEEIAVLKNAEATQLPPPIQARLLQARSRLEQRTRALLDDEQRARYDLASRPRSSADTERK